MSDRKEFITICGTVTWLVFVDMSTRQRFFNMDNHKKLKGREKIAKPIAKTSDSICKKYRVLNTGKMEKDIALERL